jgi:hypothetical protein
MLARVPVRLRATARIVARHDLHWAQLTELAHEPQAPPTLALADGDDRERVDSVRSLELLKVPRRFELCVKVRSSELERRHDGV